MTQKFTQNLDGTESAELLCEHCGKPIVKSNDYGMFCEDDCGLDESKAAFELFKNFFLGARTAV